MKKYFLFLSIVVLASFLRFWQIDKVPSGITNDEAGYMYSAYSIWKTGHDITGSFFPLSFNLDNSFSPVPVYLISPFVGLFGLSIFTGRLFSSLSGIGSVILIYFIAKYLFKNQGIALAGMFVLAVSPWHLQFSRSAYEAGLALFFILLGTVLFMRGVEKRGEILWSLPFFILAFYSYHATKVFLIFYIPFLLFFYREKLLNNKKIFFLFVIGIILTFLSFLIVIKTQHVTRQGILLWNNTKDAQQTVDRERKLNSAPFFLRQIFNNKPLYFLRIIRENYLEAFSPNFLFLYGETSGVGSIYGVFNRGEFYILELPLLLLGFFYLFTKGTKSNRFFIIVAILMAPIPSAITFDKSYGTRSIMLLPFLSIVVGCGIYYCVTDLFSKNRRIFVVILSCFYVFLVSSYLYQYYFRYSIYGAESWRKSDRNLIDYIAERKNDYKNIYVSNAGKMFLLQYGVFNKVDPSIMEKAWQSSPSKLDNITFLESVGCSFFDNYKENRKNNMFFIQDDCDKNSTPSARIKDFGEPLRTIWKIYEYK